VWIGIAQVWYCNSQILKGQRKDLFIMKKEAATKQESI
jgi:hypothetical protein